MTPSESIQAGNTVRCLANSIDKQVGKDAVGRVTGFARFSSYHPREAFVTFDEKPADSGWFWVRDLAAA